MKKQQILLAAMIGMTTLSHQEADAAAKVKKNVNKYSYNTPVTVKYNGPKVSSVQKTVTYKAPVQSNSNVRSIALSVASGKSYVYGANSASAVDCSAFAQQVMAAMGKSIPRTTYSQMSVGTRVTNPMPGDLVFFNGGSHVGVYVGNGMMVDALNPSSGVGERPVSWISGSVTGYYRY